MGTSVLHVQYFGMRSIRSSLASGILGTSAMEPPRAPELPPIVQAGDLVLRARAREVEPARIVTDEMKELVRIMTDVMHEAPGVGLAAPQIGIPLRVIVLEDTLAGMSKVSAKERRDMGRVPFPLRVLFNPELQLLGDVKATFLEGCLSVSGFAALVERHLEVEVTGLDENAEPQTWRVSGWPARILQHECDHLNGTLYIDRMISRSFATSENASKSYGGKSVAEIKRLLNV